MELNEIKELMTLLENSSLEEIKLEKNGTKIKLKKACSQAVQVAPIPMAAPAVQATAPVEVAPAPALAANTKQITSPMVGTFYASSTPGAAAFASIGDKVSANTTVCMIEAMKLFNEIEAEVEGEIIEIHVTNGQLVEFGQPLFTVKI